jgi:hypothetical protein
MPFMPAPHRTRWTQAARRRPKTVSEVLSVWLRRVPCVSGQTVLRIRYEGNTVHRIHGLITVVGCGGKERQSSGGSTGSATAGAAGELGTAGAPSTAGTPGASGGSAGTAQNTGSCAPYCATRADCCADCSYPTNRLPGPPLCLTKLRCRCPLLAHERAKEHLPCRAGVPSVYRALPDGQRLRQSASHLLSCGRRRRQVLRHIAGSHQAVLPKLRLQRRL